VNLPEVSGWPRWRTLLQAIYGELLYNQNSSRRLVTVRSCGEGWRVGRVAEGGGLLNRCRTKSSTGGSNPPLSAIIENKGLKRLATLS
jgi:hypothetical protein